MSDESRFSKLCSALDVVGDTEAAIASYLGAENDSGSTGDLYLRFYGILQVLAVQQDALKHIAESLHARSCQPCRIVLPINMSEEITEIVIPILRSIQTDLASVKSDVSILKKAVTRLDHRTASMDAHLAGFYSSMRMNNDDMDDIRGRIEALERKAQKDDEPQP